MPANKNAVIRYMYLDQMLSDRHHYYSRTDLHEKCNARLVRDGYDEVSKRTIELDLIDMSMPPFSMDIDDSMVIGGKHIVRYSDQTMSLFSKPLSDDEKRLLREALNTMGQFSGLENFEWIADLQEKLDDDKSFGGKNITDEGSQRKIISFSTNPYLKNINLLGKLFSAISNKKVIAVDYKKFDSDSASEFVVYPYLLKEHNDRWYLICNSVGDKVHPYKEDFLLNLALDRIVSFNEVEGLEYKDCPIDLEERFDDIIGVSYYEYSKLEKILFAVTNTTANYLRTKPMHASQAEPVSSRQSELKEQYPLLSDRVFFTIECRPNFEMQSLLRSYGPELIVLSPEWIKDSIKEDAEKSAQIYSRI
ncbi:MAG: WYL domain-containing protein [Bacteroidales bacterium]|nr:WYL domain-containing protein [Bacteroidales bacterium]